MGEVTNKGYTLPTDKSRIDPHSKLHNTLLYPDLGLEVWIEGNCFRAGAVAMFAKAGCKAAVSPEAADLVVFLGGEDINPALYGEKPCVGTYFNEGRDAREKAVFEKCVELETPMFGICRGMQLLHALNGSKLYQHVERHTSPHSIIDLETNEILISSSMHHQMCIEDGKQIPVAYTYNPRMGPDSRCLSETYYTYGSELASNQVKELEAAYYPDIRAFAVQGHPEVGGYATYTRWCMIKLRNLFAELEATYSVKPEALPAPIHQPSK